MKDSFPFKIYTTEGLIISECSTMSEAIARAKKLECSWYDSWQTSRTMHLKQLIERQLALQAQAKEFWKDEKNSLEERIDCFNTFAETEHWVIARDNSIQRQLFDKVQEDDMFSKYETVTYDSLIDIYLDDQERSEEVIERMRTYLWNKILQGNFKGFKFDW